MRPMPIRQLCCCCQRRHCNVIAAIIVISVCAKFHSDKKATAQTSPKKAINAVWGVSYKKGVPRHDMHKMLIVTTAARRQ